MEEKIVRVNALINIDIDLTVREGLNILFEETDTLEFKENVYDQADKTARDETLKHMKSTYDEVFSDYEKIRVPAVLNSEKMGVFVEGEDVVKSLYKLLCHNNPNVFTSTSAEMKNPGLYIFYNNAPHGSSWTKRAVREGKEAEQMLVSLVYLQRQYADLKRNEVYTKLLKK